MRPTQEARRLRTNLDTKKCTLREGEIGAMEESLGPLEAVTASFPFADLYVTIKYAPRSEEYHVKTTLRLPGADLFTGEHDSVILPAYERCIRKLVRKCEAYKQRMSSHHGVKNKFVEGTRQEMDPTEIPVLEKLEQAYAAQDYETFRQEISGFEEPVRRRVGRWIQRFPELDETFGEYLPMDDLVEEVLLTAFEEWETRPEVMRLGDWLESLIAPSLRSFLEHPEEELEAISYARTLQEMREGRKIPLHSDPAVLDLPPTDGRTDPIGGTPPEDYDSAGGAMPNKPR